MAFIQVFIRHFETKLHLILFAHLIFFNLILYNLILKIFFSFFPVAQDPAPSISPVKRRTQSLSALPKDVDKKVSFCLLFLLVSSF